MRARIGSRSWGLPEVPPILWPWASRRSPCATWRLSATGPPSLLSTPSTAYDFANTLTWVRSRHLLKFGGQVLRNQFFQPRYNNSRGRLNVQGRVTSVPMADFLLGYLNNGTRQVGSATSYLFSTSYGFFAQDDFKVSPNLTLNLGLRYEITKPPVEKFGHWANYIPETRQADHRGRHYRSQPPATGSRGRLDRPGRSGAGLRPAEIADLHQLPQLRAAVRLCMAARGRQQHGGARRVRDLLCRHSCRIRSATTWEMPIRWRSRKPSMRGTRWGSSPCPTRTRKGGCRSAPPPIRPGCNTVRTRNTCKPGT